MSQSDTIGKLAEALAKAQSEIKPPKRTRTGRKGNQTYKYADFAALIDALRGPLAKHGLAWSQAFDYEVAGGGFGYLQTTLLHSSGEWVQGRYRMTHRDDPKDQGSENTYAQRYSLQAIVGVSAEDDDDGERAQGAPTAAAKAKALAEPTEAEKLVAQVWALAEQLHRISDQEQNTIAGLIIRASAFIPKGADPLVHPARNFTLPERWVSNDPFDAPGVKFITDPKPSHGEKWLAGTCKNLLERIAALDISDDIDTALASK